MAILSNIKPVDKELKTLLTDASKNADSLVAREESPALEAERLVNGDRNSDYGHPLDDFTKTARLWSVILGKDVTPEQVALCMLQVKVSRQLNKNKRDNLVDIIGYTLTLDKVISEKERRAKLIDSKLQNAAH